jgi:hypothetical protein
MLHTIEVEVDSSGQVRPVAPSERVPAGRALLTILVTDSQEPALLAEQALAADWLRPEEDKAWAHLQQDRS